MEMAFYLLGAISNCPRGTEASLEVLLLSSKEKKVEGCKSMGDSNSSLPPYVDKGGVFLFFFS